MVGGILLGFTKVFGSCFLGFVTGGDVKTSKGDFFYLSRVSLNGSQADPFLFIYLLFSCRMTRGYEDVLAARMGVERGLPGKCLLQAV